MKWVASVKDLPSETGSVLIAIILGDEFVYDMYMFRKDHHYFVCCETGNRVSMPQYWCQPTNPELQKLN